MNILLLSMPDSFEHMPTVAIRMPNGALSSLAGNIDHHHRVAIADLVLVQSRVRPTVERLLEELRPDIVGLSVMTFQRSTAFALIHLIKSLRPDTQIVVGGYDPSLAPEVYEANADVGFIVRGEGERTFSELVRALERGESPAGVAGLSYRAIHGIVRNPDRAIVRLAAEPLQLPNRAGHPTPDGSSSCPAHGKNGQVRCQMRVSYPR